MNEQQEAEIKAVILAVETQVSNACIGPARAYFEFPTPEGIVRGIYRTYVIQAPTSLEALKALQHCIEDQITRASSLSMTTALFWRLEDKIELEQMEGEGAFRARTRLVILPEDNE